MRKRALYLNTIASLSNMFITLICGFILPRFILKGFGSDVNGLVTSVTQFLSFISFMDLGVGAVIQSAYYKPLACNDNKEVSLLYFSSKHYFRIISYILIIYVILLCFIFPFVTHSNFSYSEIDTLIVIMAMGLFAQYFLSVSDQLLLNADQKLYVQSGFQSITVLINTLLSIILIYANASIHIVKLASSLVFLTRPLFYHYYVKKHYNIDRNINIKGYKIEQKWNGLAQHIATVIMNNTDIMVLTIFSHISTVSVYSVYALVTNGIKQFINALSGGFSSLLGDLYARNEKKKLVDTFILFQWGINNITIALFSVASILIIPFVKLYTNGINDANYNQPLFAFLLIAGQVVFCIRIPYNTMICSAGHYKQTQMSALIEAIMNIIVSTVLVFKLGLIGVAIGTLIAISYRTISFAAYLHKNIICIDIKVILKQLLVDLIECAIILVVGLNIIQIFPSTTVVFTFIVTGLSISICTLLVIITINTFLYNSNMKFVWLTLCKNIFKK